MAEFSRDRMWSADVPPPILTLREGGDQGLEPGFFAVLLETRLAPS
jgi:hypothetical protein